MSAAAFFKAHEKVLDGGLPVRRVLPAAARQSVGPFLFLDHFGPIDVEPHANHDVPPHPHIGREQQRYAQVPGETEWTPLPRPYRP